MRRISLRGRKPFANFRSRCPISVASAFSRVISTTLEIQYARQLY